MQTSGLPTRVAVPFANSGNKNTIPVASQIGIVGGLASFTDGFPPLTMTPITAGGIPPFGADFNGILNAITVALRWGASGSGYPFDSAFAATVTGYPKGALLPSSDFSGYWLNTTEANSTTPENSTSVTTGWVPGVHYGVTALTGLASSSVTLTTLQAAKTRITLAGTLTANINLVFPAWLRNWTVVNNCSGAFSVTCKTISGTGVSVVNGSTANITGDGTNITLDANVMNISAQVTGTVGQALNAKMSITSASATATFTADELIVGTALGGAQYRLGNFSKTINLANTGAGGMDTGTAPVSGYVALYAIYNPTTGASALLAVNASASVAPQVYGGANMPAGYTASALISVWPTSSGAQFLAGSQVNRNINTSPTRAVLATSTQYPAGSTISIATLVPPNAVLVSGSFILTSSATSLMSGLISSDSLRSGEQGMTSTVQASSAVSSSFSNISIPTSLLAGITLTSSAGTPSFSIYITCYSF